MEWDDAARIYKLCWFNVYLKHVSHIWMIKQNGVARWLLAITLTTRLQFCHHEIQSRYIISIELLRFIGTQALCYAWCCFQYWLIDWLIEWVSEWQINTLDLTPHFKYYCEEIVSNRSQLKEVQQQSRRTVAWWLIKSSVIQWRYVSCRDCIMSNETSRLLLMISV